MRSSHSSVQGVRSVASGERSYVSITAHNKTGTCNPNYVTRPRDPKNAASRSSATKRKKLLSKPVTLSNAPLRPDARSFFPFTSAPDLSSLASTPAATRDHSPTDSRLSLSFLRGDCSVSASPNVHTASPPEDANRVAAYLDDEEESVYSEIECDAPPARSPTLQSVPCPAEETEDPIFLEIEEDERLDFLDSHQPTSFQRHWTRVFIEDTVSAATLEANLLEFTEALHVPPRKKSRPNQRARRRRVKNQAARAGTETDPGHATRRSNHPLSP